MRANSPLLLALMLFCLTASSVAAPAAPATQTGRRVALVVGNSSYNNVSPLANPANDARLMAESLFRVKNFHERASCAPHLYPFVWG